MNKAVFPLFMVLGVVLILSGCVSVSDTGKKDYSDYKMPSGYEMHSYEVTTEDTSRMDTYVIGSASGKVNLSKVSEDWQKAREEQDKYDTYRKIADDTTLETEEEDLEDYCDSLFSNSCLKMGYIKDHNGCREVSTTCDRYNSDDVCVRYDINIKPEYVKDSLCSDI